MGDAALDIHTVKPWPGAIGIAGKIHQRPSIEQNRINDAAILRRDPLRSAAAGADAPDVQFVGEGTLREVDKGIVGRPQGKGSVDSGGGWEDGLHFRLSLRAAVSHEQGIPGVGGVVCESGAVVGPVKLGNSGEVRPRLSAQRWYGPDADIPGA